ncbi:MAG: IS66 family insertion sequence element accessory protein TnpA [bacterium]
MHASALSQTEFCHQEGFAYWTFRHWLRKYRLQEALPASPVASPADFIPRRDHETGTIIQV